MGIITLDEVELAYGSDIPDEDEPRIEYYIDVVTSYIEDVTGMSFTEQEDVEEVCVTDKYGVIDFFSPVTITEVEEYDAYVGSYSSTPTDSYAFNGVSSLYGLYPYATYRVTISYGVAEAPDSLKGLAAELVLAATDLDPSAVNGLVMKRVGDREEQYGVSSEDNNVSITTLQSMILKRYMNRAWQYRV